MTNKTLRELTGYTFEEIRRRRFQPLRKIMYHRLGNWQPSWNGLWRYDEDELIDIVASALEELEEPKEVEKQEAKEWEEGREAIRQNYLNAIEWFAKHGGVDDWFIPVLRRAWKQVKTAKEFEPAKIFEVPAPEAGTGKVFNGYGLKESLKRRGKRMTDFL